MLKEGHHTQPHLSCLNLHFPSSRVRVCPSTPLGYLGYLGNPIARRQRNGWGKRLALVLPERKRSLNNEEKLVANLISPEKRVFPV